MSRKLFVKTKDRKLTTHELEIEQKVKEHDENHHSYQYTRARAIDKNKNKSFLSTHITTQSKQQQSH
jgi:hypothetical protein